MTRAVRASHSKKWALCVVVLPLLLTDCGGNSAATASATTTTGGASASSADKPNGVLRYGVDMVSSFSGTLDPSASTSTCDSIALALIYDTLVHVNRQGKLVPGLAQSWSLQGKTFILHLRPDVVFQDGTPFNAQAVKEGLLHNEKGPQTGSDLNIISSIDVINPLTLRLNLSTTAGSVLPYDLTSRDGMIVAPSSLAKRNSGTDPIGAGPYRFVSEIPGSSRSLQRWSHYWDPSAQTLGGIDFIQASSGAPGVSALLAGDIGILQVDPEALPAVADNPAFKTASTASATYLQLQFRLGRAPFNSVKLRQAVLYAINRSAINRVVLAGKGIVATEVFPPGSAYYVPSVGNLYPYDPSKARQLLAEAGKPHGFSFQMVIPGGVTFLERQAEIIQSELAQVGIKAQIVEKVSSDIASYYYDGGNGDAFAAEELGDINPTGVIAGEYDSGQYVAIKDGGVRPDINALMVQAQSSANPDVVQRDVRQAVTIIAKEALEEPIAFIPVSIAWNPAQVGGMPVAPIDGCHTIDMRTAFVKR
jgi:peptide/nickel transport system substrate-binding protein